MKFLKEVFNLEITKEFIAICESIAQQNPMYKKDGIGVNFSEDNVECVKIYYGFTHKLSDNDIQRIHLFGSTVSFYNNEKLLSKSDYEWIPYIATGVSFALKIDKNFKASFGHFMVPEIKENDLFFSLPKVKEYYTYNDEFPILNRKGIFTLINEKGIEDTKDYYYVTHPKLKEIINRDFNINLQLSPIVEWVIGKGFYQNSTVNDEKIILLENTVEVYEKITKPNIKWKSEIEFNDFMFKNFNCKPLPPGYYKNNKIRSYYYFNYNDKQPTIMTLISVLKEKLKLL